MFFAISVIFTADEGQALCTLHEVGADQLPDSRDAEQRRKEQQKTMASIKRLQQVIGITLLNSQSQPGADPSQLLTPEGIELLDIVGRFFADLDAFGQSHTNHGPSVRLASSTTLLHWLILPSIRELQRRASEFGELRQPEISFQQIELDEAASGLSSHLFQFAVIRESAELPVTLLHPEPGQILEEELATWARWTDAEFAKHHQQGGASHGHRRIGWILGSYDYVLCMRPDFHGRIVEHAKLAGRHWQQDLPVALCTNHRKFADDLRNLERRAGLRVVTRTDTWVESAQLAIYGDYATILPSIALAVNPLLAAHEMRGLNLPSENVALVLNPSILRSHTYRQMLSTTVSTLSATLAGGASPVR